MTPLQAIGPLAAALPTSIGDWLSAVAVLFVLVAALGAATGILRSKQYQAVVETQQAAIDSLKQLRDIDHDAAVEQEKRHHKELADLRAQVSVLHSDFLANLAESIVTAVIDTLHPLLPEERPPARRPPRKRVPK